MRPGSSRCVRLNSSRSVDGCRKLLHRMPGKSGWPKASRRSPVMRAAAGRQCLNFPTTNSSPNLASVTRRPEESGGANAARGTDHRGLRRHPCVSSRRTVARRSMARNATSSSGFMRCALTSCEPRPIAAPCSLHIDTPRPARLTGCAKQARSRGLSMMTRCSRNWEQRQPAPEDDITVLKHVASREEKRAAEEIANRTPCADFDDFQAAVRTGET